MSTDITSHIRTLNTAFTATYYSALFYSYFAAIQQTNWAANTSTFLFPDI
jgi:hypothetical protein